MASVRRQLRSCQAWLSAGWFIAAVYSDVESGATDLEARSRGTAHKILTDAGLPRDGGMAELLAESASPNPRFAVVVCEDIERSARDTFNALKLEKELSRQGIPLFATDEPADIACVNATTVLVRRVKQGVAEWYRLQLKEKIWKGFEEHNAEGWNIGTPPYGYRAERHPHPNPAKAGQGRTKTRLILHPAEKTVVETIFRWRTVKKLGVPTIAAQLNADPAAYPPPEGSDGWTAATVQVILGNPKYTGHQVYGRRRNRNGRRLTVPADQWLWTPQPVHDPIVSVETWKDAQDIGAGHASSRDYGPGPNPAGRIYPYRSRIRCHDCQRRMAANPFPSYVYYRCPYTPSNPRHVKASPGHPRTVQVSETLLDVIVGRFYRDRLFTPGRAQLLAAQLPASDTEATTRRDEQATALRAQIRKLETQQNAQIHALEDAPDGLAGKDMRARINTRFAELHAQRTAAETQLAALTAEKPTAADSSLLDELPYLGDILPSLPPALKTRLLDIFDLTVTWNKAKDTDSGGQVTLTALPEINPRQDGYHDTAPTPLTSTAIGHSTEPPIAGSCHNHPETSWESHPETRPPPRVMKRRAVSRLRSDDSSNRSAAGWCDLRSHQPATSCLAVCA